VVDKIDLSEDRNKLWAVVNAVMDFWVTQIAVNFFDWLRNKQLSRRTVLLGVSPLAEYNCVIVHIFSIV